LCYFSHFRGFKVNLEVSGYFCNFGGSREYFGHFMSSGGIWIILVFFILVFSRYFGGSGIILIILEVLGLFGLFFRFQGSFGHFGVFRCILVILISQGIFVIF
jgi:hypothetical protein